MGEILSKVKVAAIATGAAMFVVACGQPAAENTVAADEAAIAADASTVETIDGTLDPAVDAAADAANSADAAADAAADASVAADAAAAAAE